MQVPPHIPGESDPDIVIAMIREVLEIVPLTDEQAYNVERRIRAKYGGERCIIPKHKKHATERKRSEVQRDICNGQLSDREIQSRHGISRATMYRWAKRGPTEDQSGA